MGPFLCVFLGRRGEGGGDAKQGFVEGIYDLLCTMVIGLSSRSSCSLVKSSQGLLWARGGKARVFSTLHRLGEVQGTASGFKSVQLSS